MSKTIKTPALENADFSLENSPALKEYQTVYNGQIIRVFAETNEQATELLQAEIEKLNSENN